MIETGRKSKISPMMRPNNGSSHFNLYSDTNVQCTTTARTLDSTYVANRLNIWIKINFPIVVTSSPQSIESNPVPLVNDLSYGDSMEKLNSFIGGGLYHNDGTNRFIYRNSYTIKAGATPDDDFYYMRITRWIIRQAGTISLPATTYNFRAGVLVPSYSEEDLGGFGGGPGAGTRYYWDKFIFDTNGDLESSSSGDDVYDFETFGGGDMPSTAVFF